MRAEARWLYVAALFIASIPETGTAAESCPPLTRITSVDTVTGPGGYMLVPVKIGEAQRLMLFDTGGSLSSITPTAAQELHIPTYDSRMRIAGVTGKVSSRAAIIPSIVIGTVESKQAQYMVLPDDLLRGLNPGGVAGILAPAPGIDIDIDFAGHTLAFFSPDHCAGKVVYWPASAVAVVAMRNAGLQPGSGLSTERIMIPVTLDGKQIDALIDTGSTDNVLKLTVAEDRFGVDLKSPDIQPLGQLGSNASAKTYRKQFATLSFDGVTVTNPVLDLIPDRQTGAFGEERPTGSLTRPPDRGLPDLIVGMSVLSKLHMYVAYKERKVYITAAAPAGVQTASASRPAEPALQIAGSWNITSQPVRPVCDIVQNVGELSGSCAGAQAGGELTGTVAGQAIRWQWKRIAKANGNVSLWNFSGTMSEDNRITGFVELNGRTAPFTAMKQ